jgi:transposase
VLYDVSSSYVEGRCCELARFGHSRDSRPDKMQIVFGLLCAADGCPVAIEVFEGNTGDPSTLGNQIAKLKERFGLKRVIMVGDRGMITQARIEEELKPAGLDWITALRAPAIQQLAAEGGPLQLSLFDERDLAEIESPDFPGERLVVCKNPALAEERKRKRDELLDATEQDLKDIQARIVRKRQPLRGADKIGLAVGALLGRRKVAKHFRITITDGSLSFTRDHAAIATEAALDGFYVLRTSVPADALNAADTVRAYKSLANVERAFRSLKTVDLDIRPVFHRVSPRVRAHVFLCMLAYHLEWHMRQALAPILFDDHDRAAGEALRTSPVAKARPSPAAKRKAKTKRTDDGLPVHSFRTLLADLATLTRNTVRCGKSPAMALLARPTQIQQRAFDLLGVKPQL